MEAMRYNPQFGHHYMHNKSNSHTQYSTFVYITSHSRKYAHQIKHGLSASKQLFTQTKVLCDVIPCHYVSNAWLINGTQSFITSGVPPRDIVSHLRRNKTSEIPQWESQARHSSYFQTTHHLCIHLARLCKHTPNHFLSLDLLHPEVLLLKLSFLTHYHLKHIKQIQ